MPPKPHRIRIEFSPRPPGVCGIPRGARSKFSFDIAAGEKGEIRLGRDPESVQAVVPFVRPTAKKEKGMLEFVSRRHGVLKVDYTGDKPKMQFVDTSTYGTGIGRKRPQSSEIELAKSLGNGESFDIKPGDHLVFGARAGELVEDPGRRPKGAVHEEYIAEEVGPTKGWFLVSPDGRRSFMPHAVITVHEKK